jgi:MFS superfamily sulfate permease-like transporter
VGKLFGITTGSGDFFMEVWQFIIHLGETNGWTLLIEVLSLVILFGLPRLFPRIPAALVASSPAFLTARKVLPQIMPTALHNANDEKAMPSAQPLLQLVLFSLRLLRQRALLLH